MATFDNAIGYLLVNEGSKLFASNQGEYSKYGITLKLASQLGLCKPDDHAFIENLDVQSATDFYHSHVWYPMLDGIANQNIATKLFDMGVNMGRGESILLAQRACNVLGAAVKPDGQPGYQTLTAINTRDPQQLLLELCAECVDFYKLLVTKNPEKFQQFWEAWKTRGEKRP